jgi:uncharacterized protein YjgD (DUF1641 family)
MNGMADPNPPVDDVNRLALAAREALTDQMIERVAITGGTALEVLDRLNDEATSAAVHRLIDRLTEMEQSGSLDTACDMVMLLHAMRDALTDQMIERLTSYAEYMVTSVANEDVLDLVAHACQAMNEAAEESAKAPARGLMATISMLLKPETQRSLQFLRNLAGKMQNRMVGGNASGSPAQAIQSGAHGSMVE